ncbi:MAG: insulinase family protein, partial [Saezia sp.]
TQEELMAAKANLLGGFPLMFDSNKKLLSQVMNIARNDLPLDYLDQWPHLVEAVTAEQIKVAMQKVIQPGRLVTVVVGAEQVK